MATLERAIQIAYEAHEGQTRYDGSPYVGHPLRVMGALAAAGYGEKEQILGVLHDVVEDSDWTLEDIANEGFDSEIVEGLGLVTKEEGQDQDEYIDNITKRLFALIVKVFDMDNNLNDNPTPEQVKKYQRAFARIAMRAGATIVDDIRRRELKRAS